MKRQKQEIMKSLLNGEVQDKVETGRVEKIKVEITLKIIITEEKIEKL